MYRNKTPAYIWIHFQLFILHLYLKTVRANVSDTFCNLRKYVTYTINSTVSFDFAVALLASKECPTLAATPQTTNRRVYQTAESSLLSPLHFWPFIQSKCILRKNTNGSPNPSSFSWASNTATVAYTWCWCRSLFCLSSETFVERRWPRMSGRIQTMARLHSNSYKNMWALVYKSVKCFREIHPIWIQRIPFNYSYSITPLHKCNVLELTFVYNFTSKNYFCRIKIQLSWTPQMPKLCIIVVNFSKAFLRLQNCMNSFPVVSLRSYQTFNRSS